MKRYLFGFATVLAAAGVTSLITARRIEAQYSSPVKVVNTTSAPAIASLMDDPGRTPYQSDMNNNTCTGFSACAFFFAPVPAGHRLVITRIAADFFISPPAANTTLTVSLGGASASAAFNHAWNPPILNQNPVLEQSVTAYLDAGQTFIVGAQLAPGGTFFGSVAEVTVTGYMLDCTAAPCAPIAH